MNKGRSDIDCLAFREEFLAHLLGGISKDAVGLCLQYDDIRSEVNSKIAGFGDLDTVRNRSLEGVFSWYVASSAADRQKFLRLLTALSQCDGFISTMEPHALKELEDWVPIEGLTDLRRSSALQSLPFLKKQNEFSEGFLEEQKATLDGILVGLMPDRVRLILSGRKDFQKFPKVFSFAKEGGLELIEQYFFVALEALSER